MENPYRALAPWLIKAVRETIKEERTYGNDVKIYIPIVERDRDALAKNIPSSLGYKNQETSLKKPQAQSGDIAESFISEVSKDIAEFGLGKIVEKVSKQASKALGLFSYAADLAGSMDKIKRDELNEALKENYKLQVDIARYNEIGFPKTLDEGSERKKILAENSLSSSYRRQ